MSTTPDFPPAPSDGYQSQPPPPRPYQQPAGPYQGYAPGPNQPLPGQYHPYPGGPYQQPGGPYQQYPPPYQQSTNGFAIASMVLGILWLYGVGAILALVFGYIARKQIRESGGRQKGGGMAVAGIVLGWIGSASLLIIVIVVIAHAQNSGS
jgi:hypothetical protein